MTYLGLVVFGCVASTVSAWHALPCGNLFSGGYYYKYFKLDIHSLPSVSTDEVDKLSPNTRGNIVGGKRFGVAFFVIGKVRAFNFAN